MSQINCSYIKELNSGLSILSYWSAYLCLCQYLYISIYLSYCFADHCNIVIQFELRKHDAPRCVLLRINLVIHGVLWFYMNDRIVFSLFEKKMLSGFFVVVIVVQSLSHIWLCDLMNYKACIDLYITLSKHILIVLSLSIYDDEMPFLFFVYSISFSSIFQSF